MEVERFDDIEKEFTSRVRSMIWCSVATVDHKQRPYSRILHPLWEGHSGWILTHRDSHKARHLERNPFESPANPNFGVLKLSPWRIALVTFPAGSYDAGHPVWRDRTVR